ncbi:alpha/beta hydrolase [Paenibacillus glacialis]|uniref:PET hydrolase/cutinase-like domain-containing protein n=1 Tax=Paenibacillus glacialis TaxID=494026 RepID=A0A168I6S4_9BACL|nr:alpha/beta hydrolase [Paenibacillus glacialis]OAB38926.1 hypothetical protein PGLA_19345 [Paenibacillus glacialis]
MLQIKRVLRNKWFLGTTGIISIILVSFSIVSFLQVHSVPATFELGSIEEKYASPGEYKVEAVDISDEVGEKLYKIYYPQLPNSKHPLIAWGNGTGALPEQYDELFLHLASWGFVVIDTYSTTTGTGKEILDAIEYMLAENDAPTSLFYQKVQSDQIAAAGHSQGSTGVINAHTNFDRGVVIKTVVSIALPDLKWCDPEDVYDTSALKVPFFVMGGTRDFIVSPASSNKLAVSHANLDIQVMMALAKGAGHTAIEQDGGKHRGYLTAWMRYQLMGDSQAMRAFVGDDAEILTNGDWKDVISVNSQKTKG